MNLNILVVEDERHLSESILQYLAQGGMKCRPAFTYTEAVSQISANVYDCIVIDIGLPDGSGIDLIKYIKRKKLGSGLIIISAKNSLEDKLEGLNTGADDFLTKPFHLSELNARVNALMRRKKFDGKNTLEYNEIKVNPEDKNVRIGEKKLNLTTKEIELLIYFISNADKILTKDAIAYNLWKNNADLAISSDIIYTHIKNLRKKLIENGVKDYIQAIYGIGYKFGE
ncbi:MAG TPA: response regulator transcription factor [Bacteroidia bacterium]|jgi:DNA-binding response OmpR family regulator|nr:response regulator transcription factor [Bacteroidia bacterium]